MKLISIPMMVVLIFAGAGVVWAEEGPFPVRLNPRLGLESVDPAAIDARLNGPLWPDLPDKPGLELFKVADPSSYGLEESFEERVIDRKLATNCVELEQLTEAGYVGRRRNDRGVQRRLMFQCRMIRMLQDVRPSDKSYVHDFVLDAKAVDVLPPMIDNGAIFDRLCEEYVANQKGIAWSEFDTIVTVEGSSPRSAG